MFKKIVFEILLVLFLLGVSGASHAYNMFNYPYFENDEGTYMSQAWSLVSAGKLAPYTYWYDHAPFGWVILSGWIKLVGGVFAFGTSVETGRVFMLLVHLLNTLAIYVLVKKFGGGKLGAAMAVFVFALSPLGIYFQRRVLLDNIMIMLVFGALILVLNSGKKFRNIYLSAIVLGIAILTKENAIFFVPVFIYILFTNLEVKHKGMVFLQWLLVLGSVVSVYFLYAFLKGELFPPGFMGSSSSHVSLLSTLYQQFSRGNPTPFWYTTSDFYKNFVAWVYKDPFTLLGGSVATLLCLVLSVKFRRLLVPALLAIFFWVFLLRGKLVLDFYVVPLIPLLAMCIGLVFGYLVNSIRSGIKFLWWVMVVGLYAEAIYLLTFRIDWQYTRSETHNQKKSIIWVKENLSPNTPMVIDDSIFVDLHVPGYPKGSVLADKVFPNADWAWKVEEDPEIFKAKLGEDWSNISYIILSHEILKQIHDSGFKFVKEALDNSTQVIKWTDNTTSYVDVDKYISTNGDWGAVYKVEDKNKIVLDSSWRYYKETFLKSYGQIVDPQSGNTTSEGQSYALLRAVWENDKKTFDSVYAWTKDHLGYRGSDTLYSWLWLNGGDGKVGDAASASDADEDIALALAFAYKNWGDEVYLTNLQQLLNDIWKNEVVKISGHYYFTSGSGATRDKGYLVNPSYLAPASYRVFAKFDREHDWTKLASDSYYLLNKLGTQSANKIYLPPNWILIEKDTGDILSPSEYISAIDASWYGFDAFRTLWRISLDDLWFDNIDAKDYLAKTEPFVSQSLANGSYAIYSLDGTPQVNYSSLSTTTGMLFGLEPVKNADSHKFYTDQIMSKFDLNNGYWGDGKNYYDQNWGWFASAYFTNHIPRP